MASRAQTITIEYYAWDTSANGYKTGDVANHTLRWTKDGTSSAPTNSPAEVDATNKPGAYKLVITGTEATCNVGILGGKSSTANIVIVPTHISFEQLPTAAPDAAGGLPVSDVGGLDLDARLDAAVSSRMPTTHIGATAGAVDNVTTVATTTTNTDMRGTDSAALASALATAQTDLGKITGTDGATLATAQVNYAPAKAGDNMGTVSSVTGAVGSVTGNVGGNVVGSTASVTGAVGSVAGNVGGNVTGSVGSNLELGPAEVNAEVVDVMKTDTIAEMAQQAPPTTPTFEEAVMYLYMALVHKGDVTATLKEFHNNAGTVIWKKTLSDDGTTYSEAESVSGP